MNKKFLLIISVLSASVLTFFIIIQACKLIPDEGKIKSIEKPEFDLSDKISRAPRQVALSKEAPASTGNLTLTVNWTAENITLPGITGKLITGSGITEDLVFTATNDNKATYTGTVAAGLHTLIIKLLDNGLLVYGTVKMIKIVPGETTTGEFNLSIIPYCSEYETVTITPEIDNPLNITLDKTIYELPPGNTATFSASVPPGTGTVTYAWYLNGERQTTGSECSLEGLSGGIYNLSVTAFTADGLRAGATGFIFMVLGSSSEPVLRLMQNNTTLYYNSTFDFDTVPIVERADPVIFKIINTGATNLFLTGNPPVAIEGAHAGAFIVDTADMLTDIPAQGSTTFMLRYTSDSNTGADLTASVSVASNMFTIDPFRFTIHCTDIKIGPEIEITRDAAVIPNGGDYNFGNREIYNGPVTATFTIMNTGALPLDLTGSPAVILAGANANRFLVSSMPAATVDASGAAAFTVAFDPAAVGSKSAVLTINNNDTDENPYIINLKGTGTDSFKVEQAGKNISAGSTFDFDAISINNRDKPVTFTIRNTGGTAISLTGNPRVLLNGSGAAAFAVDATNTQSSIPANGSTTFTIRFISAANTGGDLTAGVSVPNSVYTESEFEFNIHCTDIKIGPEIEIRRGSAVIPDGGSYNFGNREIYNGPVAATFTIRNTGTLPLKLTGSPAVILSGANANQFRVSSMPAATLAASGTTTFTVAFDPAAAGSKSAVLTIKNNDTDENPYIINLKGTGADSFKVKQAGGNVSAGSTFDFDTIPAINRDKPVTFTIRNTGGTAISLTGNPRVVLSGAGAAAFTVNTTNTQSGIPANGSTTFTIQFTAVSYSNNVLTAHVSIPSSAYTEKGFGFHIHCTDKMKSTYRFTSGAEFTGTFTGYAVITLCGGAGGGGGGGGGDCVLPAPYVPGQVCNGGKGGKGGGGYTATKSSYLMQHGVTYTVILGGGGNGGRGDACKAGGANGRNGGTTYFQSNGITVFGAGGGNGGRGGSPCTSATAAAGAGGSCSAGGTGGAGGRGYYKTVTTGTPPYVTTQITCVCNSGSNGSPGLPGTARIDWVGFRLP